MSLAELQVFVEDVMQIILEHKVVAVKSTLKTKNH